MKLKKIIKEALDQRKSENEQKLKFKTNSTWIKIILSKITPYGAL